MPVNYPRITLRHPIAPILKPRLPLSPGTIVCALLFPFHSTWRAFALVACVLLLQGCSAVKLAYNQAPQLVYWRLNNYFNLTDAQADRLRSELGDLHQWHRDQMLPQHAALLQQVQQRLADDITADQACRVYADVRLQIDQLIAQVEPRLVVLASQLTESQIRNFEKQQADSNADWRREWLDVPADKLAAHRFKLLLSRAEGFYGALQEPQKAALRSFIAQSTFDPQRSYAERLRRQSDLAQVLRQIASDPASTERNRSLLRGYMERFNTSPDPAYQRYAIQLVEEGCAGFALVHRAMTPAQRLKAVQSVKGYEQNFWVLAGR